VLGINPEIFSIVSNLSIIAQGLTAGVSAERFHAPVAMIEAEVDRFLPGTSDSASLMRALGMSREPLAAFVYGTAHSLRQVVRDEPEVLNWIDLIAEQSLRVTSGNSHMVDKGAVARESAHRVYESVVAVALAHDIKNAGAAIKALIEELRSQGMPPETVSAILAEMEDQTDLMIDNTDDFRRLVEGQSGAERQAINLSQFLTERKVRSVVGAGIEIVFERGQNLNEVSCSKPQLWRAIVNLVKNAREAMEGRDPKRLTISIANAHFGAGASIAAGNYVCLTIRDTGAGIPQEKIESIFEPFHSSKNKGPEPGSPMRGLGLWQVRDLVQKYGGALSVESMEGIGTAFHLHLPSLVKTASGGDRLEPYRAGIHADKRILVVDDSPIFLKLLEKYLRFLGYGQILVVSSGEDALIQVQQGAPDLIITDHNMINMDGIEMSQKVRELFPSLPIILSSATSNLPFLGDAASRQVTKPATILDIARAVKELLSLNDAPKEDGPR